MPALLTVRFPQYRDGKTTAKILKAPGKTPFNRYLQTPSIITIPTRRSPLHNRSLIQTCNSFPSLPGSWPSSLPVPSPSRPAMLRSEQPPVTPRTTLPTRPLAHRELKARSSATITCIFRPSPNLPTPRKRQLTRPSKRHTTRPARTTLEKQKQRQRTETCSRSANSWASLPTSLARAASV